MSVSLLQIPQLRELEEKYARILGPGVLMERAGKAAADFISDLYPAPARVTVVCGPGNNGGDGYRTAIELLKKEYDVNVVQVAGKTPKSEGADRFAVQNALMPYLQLLPEDLRGKNERIDEPLS